MLPTFLFEDEVKENPVFKFSRDYCEIMRVSVSFGHVSGEKKSGFRDEYDKVPKFRLGLNRLVQCKKKTNKQKNLQKETSTWNC